MNKLYLIIITDIINVVIEKVKANLGLKGLRTGRELDLYEAQLISGGICIGVYNDNLLIVSPEKVFDFYDTHISAFEKRVCESFSTSQITVLTLNSVVDLYGYAAIENGSRRRVKSGADGNVYIDYGDKIKEELEIDINEMVDDNHLGISVVHSLLKKYFGEGENNLGNVLLTEFK